MVGFVPNLDSCGPVLHRWPRLVRSIVCIAFAALALLPGFASAQPAATTPTLLWRHQYDVNYLWLMNVDKATPVGLPPVSGSNWVVGGMGDFDGNGTRDIIWHEKTTGAVYAWYMNGTNVQSIVGLGGVETGGVGSGWTLEAVADLDGDGVPDLLWRHSVIGAVYAWYFKNDGTHTVVGLGFMDPAQYRFVGVGQFGVDKYGPNPAAKLTGIVWSNDDPSAGFYQGCAIWLYTGRTFLFSNSLGPLGGMLAQTVADFDGDGISDVLWTKTSIGANTVFYLTDYGYAEYGQAVPYTPLGYVPAATADFNGDGMTDLVFFNAGSGYALQWLMTGRGNIPVSNSLGNVGTTWFLPPQ